MKWNIENLFILEGSPEIFPDGVLLPRIQGYFDFFPIENMFFFLAANRAKKARRNEIKHDTA